MVRSRHQSLLTLCGHRRARTEVYRLQRRNMTTGPWPGPVMILRNASGGLRLGVSFRLQVALPSLPVFSIEAAVGFLHILNILLLEWHLYVVDRQSACFGTRKTCRLSGIGLTSGEKDYNTPYGTLLT